MPYTAHEWINGETITAEKMNNIEAGIAEAAQSGGGGVSTATITLTNDFSQLGDDDNYVLTKITPSVSIGGTGGTGYMIDLGNANFTVTNNQITVPTFGGSMIFTYLGGNVTGDTGGGYVSCNITAASGNVTAINDDSYGTIYAISGDGAMAISWFWSD
jgi:hypothetical protein